MAHRGRKPADETLAAELAAGRTVREACKTAGICERTAYRRLEDANFRRRVDELRAEMTSRAAGRLADMQVAAADKLGELSGHADPNVALRAAGKILDTGLRYVDLVDMQRRLDELERRGTNKGAA